MLPNLFLPCTMTSTLFPQKRMLWWQIDLSQAWDLGLRRRLFDREIGNCITLFQMLTDWVVNRAKDNLYGGWNLWASFLPNLLPSS